MLNLRKSSPTRQLRYWNYLRSLLSADATRSERVNLLPLPSESKTGFSSREASRRRKPVTSHSCLDRRPCRWRWLCKSPTYHQCGFGAGRNSLNTPHVSLAGHHPVSYVVTISLFCLCLLEKRRLRLLCRSQRLHRPCSERCTYRGRWFRPRQWYRRCGHPTGRRPPSIAPAHRADLLWRFSPFSSSCRRVSLRMSNTCYGAPITMRRIDKQGHFVWELYREMNASERRKRIDWQLDQSIHPLEIRMLLLVGAF